MTGRDVLRRAGPRADRPRPTYRRAPSGIVATKAEHTRAAVAACADVFADAAVASVQNGLGNEEVLAELVPRVIRGTILPAGAVTAPGVVGTTRRGTPGSGLSSRSPRRATRWRSSRRC